MSNASYIPNSFQTPNAIIDKLQHLLTDGEFRVLIFMCRHILGWSEKRSTRRARISLKMFVKGYSDKDGTEYGGCGLERPAVITALASLAAFGVVRKVGKATNDGQMWELALLTGGKVDIDALKARHEQKKEAKNKQTAKARQTKKQATGSIVQHTTSDEQGGMPNNTGGGMSNNTPSGMSNIPNQTNQTHSNTTTTTVVNEPDVKSEPPKPAVDPEAVGKVVRAYESHIGIITPHIKELLVAAVEEYPLDWILEAINIAVENNVLKWRYAGAILESWRVKGKTTGKKILSIEDAPTNEALAEQARLRELKAKAAAEEQARLREKAQERSA
jgi:DnaD/phage-associated family protein